VQKKLTFWSSKTRGYTGRVRGLRTGLKSRPVPVPAHTSSEFKWRTYFRTRNSTDLPTERRQLIDLRSDWFQSLPKSFSESRVELHRRRRDISSKSNSVPTMIKRGKIQRDGAAHHH
jgi:hypothetical protein